MNTESLALIARMKAVADPHRLRLLALCARGECSVSELTQILSLSQPRVSQHLKLLCDADLVQRFRDGHFVFYRVPTRGTGASMRKQILALVPQDDPVFDDDFERLCKLRGNAIASAQGSSAAPIEDGSVRALHRALVELTVAQPLGDLLDIGSGQGRLLKLLATRANRAVGVDLDADARRLARAELLLAGLPNCTLRQGNMYALPFDGDVFDSVILDDVLAVADDPVAAIEEAVRVLRPGGRLIFLLGRSGPNVERQTQSLLDWSRQCGLRLGAPRPIPSKDPDWLLAIATRTDQRAVAA